MRSPQFRSYLDSTSNGVLVRWHSLALISKKAFRTFSAGEFACHMLRFASPSGRSITPNIYHNTLKMCTCDSFRFVFFSNIQIGKLPTISNGNSRIEKLKILQMNIIGFGCNELNAC